MKIGFFILYLVAKSKVESFITPLNWRAEIAKFELDSINLDFVLIPELLYSSLNKYPFKLDVSVIVICIEGGLKGTVNLKQYDVRGPGIFIVMPDQILQYEQISGDFLGRSIMMSKPFTKGLLIDSYDRFPLFQSIMDNPWLPLNEEELSLALDYYSLFEKTVKMNDNPNRIDMIKYLQKAFFYALQDKYLNRGMVEKKSKQEILTSDFLSMAQGNYREQRNLEFYAEKMCLTSRYLSTVVKEVSGKTAGEWIIDFVILEAKALLRSTDMTIQQISNALNFQSQSFFGKYFKRYAGVSPKNYRFNNEN